MRNYSRFQSGFIGDPGDLGHIARPESVVMLAATVRAAREMQRRERVDGLKERVFDGGYAVSSKDLARKAERSNSFGPTSYASSGGYSAAPRRELFVTVCASCNGEARVPFQPRGDKPVYCSDCFETQRGAGRPAPRGSFR